MAAVHSAYRWTPLGYAQTSNLASAASFAGLGISVPTDTIMILISCEGGAIRWRDDGTAPTASVGMPLTDGQEFQYTVVDFSKINFIAQSGSPILNFGFYK